MEILTDQDYRNKLLTNRLAFVYFWADWCNPCKKFSPIFQEVAEQSNLFFGKIDSDANPMASTQFNIESIPTVLVFEDGVEVYRTIGAMPKHQLLKELSQWL